MGASAPVALTGPSVSSAPRSRGGRMPNPLKRQWFRPGAGVERIAKLPTSRFLLRRTPDTTHAPLPITRVAESAGAVFSTVLSVVLVVALLALVVALVREF